MYHFVAIYDAERSQRSQASWRRMEDAAYKISNSWKTVLKSENIIILEDDSNSNDMKHHYLNNRDGIVLGRLFHPKPDGETNTASHKARPHIQIISHGSYKNIDAAYLRDNFWGDYVAFFLNDSENSIEVFRSPQGRLPCYFFKENGIYTFFSNFSLMEAIGQNNYKIDWDIVCRPLMFMPYSHHETLIQGVTSLRPGQQAAASLNREKIEFLWDPIEICAREQIKSSVDAMRAMRLVTLDCFNALFSTHQKVGIYLSGGFDSSLMVGIARQFLPPEKIIGLTYYNRSKQVDEREYARVTAQRAGITLVEADAGQGDVDPTQIHRMSCTDRPVDPFFSEKRLRIAAEVAARYELPVFFDGAGGDEIFFAHKDNVAIDYILENGLDGGFLPVAMRAAWLTNKSLWTTVFSAAKARMGVWSTTIEQLCADPASFWGISDAVKNSDPDFSFVDPWLRNKTFGPCKTAQIFPTTLPTTYGSPIRNLAPVQHCMPYLSQPIVELCLRIPTYIHQHNGWDRGLARQAFSDCLAREIRLRRLKSQFTSLLCDMIKGRVEQLTEFLLEGVLASRGLLDLQAIEQMRTDCAVAPDHQYGKFAQIIDVEAWARSWSG